MPTETVIFLAATLLAFCAFAATLVYVDVSTRTVRRQNHPLPGE